jgi:hypothetical protein
VQLAAHNQEVHNQCQQVELRTAAVLVPVALEMGRNPRELQLVAAEQAEHNRELAEQPVV